MNDYSDLLFLIGAIAIYALLAHNTNNTMLQNNQMLTSSEMEYGAVSVAQNVVEKARWMHFNQATAQNLEAVNKDTLYNVDVTTSPLNLSGSENPNRKIDVKVTSKYMTKGTNSLSTVTMSYIKTNNSD